MTIFNYNKSHFTKLTCAALLTLCSSVMSGCMQSSAATQVAFETENGVTDTMIKSVNAAFRTSFLGGDWYYQGAQAINGTINAYIQIPEKLNMSKSAQVNYLKYSLCPSKTKRHMWNQLKDIPLSVHVYTFNKKHTVFANCENPIKGAAKA